MRADALVGDLLEPRRRRHAADRGVEIGDGEPQVRHHGEIDRRAARQTRRIEPDRDQFGARRRHFAPAIAEIEQHVGLARIAHGPQQRADEQRMAGRERLRPVAERTGFARQPARPSSSASSTSSLSARHQVISSPMLISGFLRLDQHARRLLDIRPCRGGCASARRTCCAPRSATWPCRSSVLVGSDRNTGPHGGVEANFRPRRVVSAIAAVDLRLPVPFGDRLRHQFVMVGLLQLVAAERVLIDRGDGDQKRNLVLPGVDHLRHGVGQADIGDDDDAGLASRRAHSRPPWRPRRLPECP